MKYFVLWLLFYSDGSYQPVDTYTSLAECKQEEARFSRKMLEKGLPAGYACLPEGTYPKAPTK